MRPEPGSLQPAWRAYADLGRCGFASAVTPVGRHQAAPDIPRRPSLRQNPIHWRGIAGSIGGLKYYVPSRTRSFRQDPYRLQLRRPRADESISLTWPPMVRHLAGTSAGPSAEERPLSYQISPGKGDWEPTPRSPISLPPSQLPSSASVRSSS